MKKLILFLLFSIGLQAQIQNPNDKILQVIKCKVEIDGHISKARFFFKATLSGIEISDTEKKQYKVKKCDVKDCDIIHLEPKQNGVLFNPPMQNWQQTLPYTITPNGL